MLKHKVRRAHKQHKTLVTVIKSFKKGTSQCEKHVRCDRPLKGAVSKSYKTLLVGYFELKFYTLFTYCLKGHIRATFSTADSTGNTS